MGVLVTGMHRSGTSMLASWVDSLGVPAGEGHEFPVDSANPRGLHERQDIVAFNDEWLKLLGGSWWAPPTVREQTWRTVDEERLAQARSELDVFRPGASDWYVKDPRTSLLLPLWDRLALNRLPVVIGLREPRDVAMSLHMRSGTTLRRGLALWLAYNRAVFSHLRGRRSLVLDANSAVHDPYGSAVELAVFCESVDVTVDASRVNRVAESVEPALLRNNYQQLEGGAERLAADLDEVYHELARRHGRSEYDSAQVIPMPEWAVEALEELSEVWDLIVRNEILVAEKATVEDLAEQRRVELVRLYNTIPQRVRRVVGRSLRRR